MLVPFEVVWVLAVAAHSVEAVQPRDDNTWRVAVLFKVVEIKALTIFSVFTRFLLLGWRYAHWEFWCEWVLEPLEVHGVSTSALFPIPAHSASVRAVCREEDLLWRALNDPRRKDLPRVIDNVLGT